MVALLDALEAIFGCSCMQIIKNEICWIHFCCHDTLQTRFLLRFGASEPRFLQYRTTLLMVFAFSTQSHLKRIQAFKNGLRNPLGRLLDPFGTFLGGVFGPLGSFGIALGRPRASKIFIRCFARPPRRPSWVLLQRLFVEVARKFAKLWSLGRTFVAIML